MKIWDPYAGFKTATLPNGLTVRAAHWPGKPWQYVGFVIHSGARHDPPGQGGLQHFVEHLASMNGKVSYQKMRCFFSDHGGTADFGETGFPYTKFSFSLPAKNGVIKKALDIFGHMLLLAQLRKKIESERQIIVGEFGQEYQNEINLKIERRQNASVFGDTYLSRFTRPLGSLESITRERISRRDLQECYDRSYTPANMTVVAVGGKSLEELVQLLSESPFAITKAGVRTELPAPLTMVKPPTERQYVVSVKEFTTEPLTTCTSMSVACLPGILCRPALRIAEAMIHSDLENEVRDKRAWSYSVVANRTNYGEFYKFTLGSKGLKIDTLEEFGAIVDVVIAKLHGKSAKFEELKRQMINSYQMIDESGESVFESSMNDVAKFQRIRSYGATRRGLRKVTFDDVREVLHWLRPEQRWTCIIKP